LELIPTDGYDEVKSNAQAINRAEGLKQGLAALRRFQTRLAELSAASSKCVVAPAPWFVLSTCGARIGLFAPFSGDLAWDGKTAPSSFSHKQLDITSQHL